MPSPEAIDAIAKLGALGFALIAIGALVSGKVRREGEVKERIADADARLAEMRTDRDEWKSIAKSALGKVDRLTDVVEAFTGKKLAE